MRHCLIREYCKEWPIIRHAAGHHRVTNCCPRLVQQCLRRTLGELEEWARHNAHPECQRRCDS